MTIADELITILGFEVRGEAAARRYEQRIEAINRGLVAFAAQATRALMVATGAGAVAAAALGRSVIKTSAQFEQFEATLTTIEGSAEKAKQSMDWISKFGKTTPYEVGEVTEAFVRLKSRRRQPRPC